MKDVHPLWGLLIFVVFVVINYILYGFKAAIKNINENDILEDREEPRDKREKKILSMIEKPNGFIITLQTITVIIDITVGVFLIRIFSNLVMSFDFVENRTLVTIIITIVMFVILEVFGMIVPSKLALRKSKDYIYRYLSTITFLQNLFLPLTFVITKMANGVVRICGVSPDIDEMNVTEEEIMDMVNEGHEQGVILESEAQMINNIFEFGDKQAEDVMIHRKNIIALDGNTTLEEAVSRFLEEGMSRFPVYEEDVDNIVGILHFKDAFKIYGEVSKRDCAIKSFKDILYDAYLIPETRSINLLFKQMQTEKVHMSIVVDEYGQTVGLVTMEDIIEEIVGNIFDEHDDEEENIKQQSENVYVVDGMTELDELEELLAIEFDEEEFDTLNGFLISKLGKIPEDDENFEVKYEGYWFKVLKVEKKMIAEVRIVKDDKDIQPE